LASRGITAALRRARAEDLAALRAVYADAVHGLATEQAVRDGIGFGRYLKELEPCKPAAIRSGGR